jgi:hypothetical protein
MGEGFPWSIRSAGSAVVTIRRDVENLCRSRGCRPCEKQGGQCLETWSHGKISQPGLMVQSWSSTVHIPLGLASEPVPMGGGRVEKFHMTVCKKFVEPALAIDVLLDAHLLLGLEGCARVSFMG